MTTARLPKPAPGARRWRRRAALGAILIGLAWATAWLPAGTVEVLILQTADVHGAIGTPSLPDEGDWRRLATTVRRLRRLHGPERVLVIDCGDTTQGSYAASQTKGCLGLAMLEALRVDAWIPGNHDLEYGAATLWRWCQDRRLPALAGNLVLHLDGQRREFPAWQCFTRGGARLAVIGATASYLRHWLDEQGPERVAVTTAASVLERVLPEILATRPDAIVLAAHQGWLESDPREVNEIRELAERYPELDLILGAHTHRPLPGLKIGPTAWYVQPPALATRLGVIQLRLDTDRHRVLDIRSELQTADELPDPDLPAGVADLLARVEAHGARRVCRLPEAVSPGGTPGVNCAASELLCRALAEASGADVALHGTLGREGLPAGDVTERHLFAFVPYENEILTAALTPAQLETVVAEQLANRASYVYCGVWGVELDCDRGSRTAAPSVRRRCLADGRTTFPPRLRVALSSYTAGGGGGRFPRLFDLLRQPASELRFTGVQTRDAVRDYLVRHPGEALVPRPWLHGRLPTPPAPGSPEP